MSCFTEMEKAKKGIQALQKLSFFSGHCHPCFLLVWDEMKRSFSSVRSQNRQLDRALDVMSSGDPSAAFEERLLEIFPNWGIPRHLHHGKLEKIEKGSQNVMKSIS